MSYSQSPGLAVTPVSLTGPVLGRLPSFPAPESLWSDHKCRFFTYYLTLVANKQIVSSYVAREKHHVIRPSKASYWVYLPIYKFSSSWWGVMVPEAIRLGLACTFSICEWLGDVGDWASPASHATAKMHSCSKNWLLDYKGSVLGTTVKY